MVSPKWETVWVESQHCSKSIVNVPVPSQQTKKILEDLKNSCCSPNKAVQAEALKCWGLWINHQNPNDWKLNSVCFSAVRPLITKKLQPLHNDVDICKLKLSLMWALLVKVQEIMELEGPQYILEVFLQSCLTWLSFTSEHGSENEVNFLIFQLLLAVFNKNELLVDCDKKMFPPLSTDILHIKKVFHRLADKFLNIFIYWRKVDDSSVVLKIWKHFLEHCELSYEHIPIPVWHKIFKLTGQICSEKESPIKERLAFLHSCATTLKSALSSSKFIDFGNLLTTPCEVLLKKLVELCTIECDEVCDSEMFLLSKEICQVLSDKSVAISGYNLCIYVLDFLEEFYLRSLFWGVWCGLVYCYKALHTDNNQNQLSKSEIKFYRKLRGVVLNFELDRNHLHEDCIKEVEKHIGLLNISCKCWLRSDKSSEPQVIKEELTVPKSSALNKVSKEIVPALQQYSFGKFSVVPFSAEKNFVPRKIFHVDFQFLKNVFNTLNPDLTKSLLSSMFTFRLNSSIQPVHRKEMIRRNMSVQVNVEVDRGKELSLIVSCHGGKAVSPLKPPRTVTKKNPPLPYKENQTLEMDKDVITTPKTRSRKRAEEEREKELEMQKRKKRKSFEVIVQEIVRKNKERKTEKNIKKKKKSDAVKSKRRNKIQKQKIKNVERQQDKENEKTHNLRGKKNKLETSDRKLRNHKNAKEKASKNQNKNEKTSTKTAGKLENYFKVITKKSIHSPKESKKPSKSRKSKKKTEEKSCCESKKEEERRGEIGWKQTSLKTMMNQKSKHEKVGQRVQTRDKIMEVAEKKPKLGSSDKKILSSPLAKRSPFKEVFHDHEYAKINPENLKTFHTVLISKKEKSKCKENSGTNETEQILPKSKVLVEEKADFVLEKDNIIEEKTLKINKPEIQRCEENVTLEAATALDQNFTTLESKILEFEETESTKIFTTKKIDLPNETKKEETIDFKPEVKSLEETKNVSVIEEKSEKSKPEAFPIEENLEVQSIRLEDNWEECTVNNLTPEKRTRKRVLIIDTLKPRKKFKSEEEKTEFPMDEKLPLEITEKENLEENQKDLVLISPVKKENTGDVVSKSDGTPKIVNGGMSRALRIIRLVPDSTMGLSWESYSKVEALKCKKAPNVDKNSRASKMLALLTENMVETEEIKTNEKETNSNLLVSTPNAKTLSPSLKSPKSIKKRKSIRFDDTRNETVIYQIDTPPSQILEEKGKRKEMKTFELSLLP